MTKSPTINPITIRGKGNLSIGRFWIEIDTITDGSHQFNPSAKRVQKFDKPITLVLWENLDNPRGMMADEDDFIHFIKGLKGSQAFTIRLWGKPNRLSDKCMVVTFTSLDEKEMSVSLSQGIEKIPFGPSVVLNIKKFFDGLGHLFPNGEI